MNLYADNILDHYRHPRGQELLNAPTVTHAEENVSCGDVLTVELRIVDGTIAGIRWSGTGCAISQAAMSMLSEELAGMKTKDVAALKPGHVYQLLGVPIGPRRFKCALLCLHTLKNALRITEGQKPQTWVETVALTEN